MRYTTLPEASTYRLIFIITTLVQIITSSCGVSKKTVDEVGNAPLPVIFETDMGNDVDDVLALDMLYKYADQGKIHLLGISTNKDNPYSVPFLRIMNNWYGYPDIPLGKVENGVNSTADAKDYAQAVYDYRQDDAYVFRKWLGD